MSPAARRSSVTGTLSLPRKDSQFWVNTSSAWSGVSMPFIASQGIWSRCASFHQAACSFATSLDDQLRLVHRTACRVQVLHPAEVLEEQ